MFRTTKQLQVVQQYQYHANFVSFCGVGVQFDLAENREIVDDEKHHSRKLKRIGNREYRKGFHCRYVLDVRLKWVES